MNIGFIGLGNMGNPMARNLAAAGHMVTGFDIDAPVPEGLVSTTSARLAAIDADVVITMLPDGMILKTL